MLVPTLTCSFVRICGSLHIRIHYVGVNITEMKIQDDRTKCGDGTDGGRVKQM